MNTHSFLKSKFLGCLFGQAIGDAIGEQTFAMPTFEDVKPFISNGILKYTDDTAQALVLAEHLVKYGKVIPEELGRMFADEYFENPNRGYAGGPPAIFNEVKKTFEKYVDVAAKVFNGRGSFGNGASMRISPLGLFMAQRSDIVNQAWESCTPTHVNKIAYDGAAVLAQLIGVVTYFDPEYPLNPNIIQHALKHIITTEFNTQMQKVIDYLQNGEHPRKVGMDIGSSVTTQGSVPFAIYSFLKYPNSFVECLECAAMYSGDRDTVAAMACAISGSYLGIEAIPKDWIDRIENREYIEDLANRLFERHIL